MAGTHFSFYIAYGLATFLNLFNFLLDEGYLLSKLKIMLSIHRNRVTYFADATETLQISKV